MRISGIEFRIADYIPERGNMRNGRLYVICALILLGIAGTAAGCSIIASAPDHQDVLSILPSDCQFVFGLDVQKLVASPSYARFQKSNSQIGNDLTAFVEETGVDPERDIDFLIGAGRSGASVTERSVIIAVGKFDKDKINAYIQTKRKPVKTTYETASLWMFPDHQSDKIDKGIVILNDREIAFGDLDSLKAVIDVSEKGSRNIMLNPTMGPLIQDIDTDEMIWFAGDLNEALAKGPVETPLGLNLSFIRTIVGTVNIGDTVVGKITAIAQDPDSAAQLANAVRGFIAIAQLTGSKNRGLKTLLSGLTVSQRSTEVSVALNLPADVFNDQILGLKSQAPSP